MKTIEFFHDVVSPYSYLAAHRIEALAERNDASVRWRPFFLGGVMKATGNQPPAALPARARHLFLDLVRWGTLTGLPITMPARFPTLTLTAMRVLVQLPEESRAAPAKALMRAYWGEGRDISDNGVLAELLGAEAVTSARQGKQALLEATEEAVQRGAYGAPTMFVDERMFFGNDRLDHLEAYLQGRLEG